MVNLYVARSRFWRDIKHILNGFAAPVMLRSLEDVSACTFDNEIFQQPFSTILKSNVAILFLLERLILLHVLCRYLIALNINPLKRVLKIIVGVIIVLSAAVTGAYFALTPGDNITALLGTAHSPLWPKRPAPGRILLKHIILVDAKSGSLAKDMTILLDNGKIKNIFRGDSAVDETGAQIVDGEGRYVVPGFLNMHMHIIDQGDPSPELALMLVNGITGFRQMSGSPELLKNYGKKRDHHCRSNNRPCWPCQAAY